MAGRKAKLDAAQNGMMVGVITALVMLLSGIFGGFSLWAIVGKVTPIVKTTDR